MISKLKIYHYLRLFKKNISVANLFNGSIHKYINYIKYKLYQKKPDLKADRVVPVYTSIVVTKRCNLSCSFCVVKDILGDKQKEFELDLAQAEKILTHPFISKSLMIMLTGGEPLLNDQLCDIIRLAKQKGHLVSLTTNGVLLHRHIKKLVNSGIDSISVSVYDDNFAILKKNLKKCSQEFPIRLNKVISIKDIAPGSPEIDKVAELAVKTGCYGVIFQSLMPNDENDKAKVIYSDNQDYITLQNRINKKYCNVLHINWAGTAPADLTGRFIKKCRQPWYLNVIDSKGNIGLCCRHQGPDFGNIFTDQFNKIKNSDYWQDLRKKLLSEASQVPDECLDCYLLSDSLSGDV